MMTLTGGFVCLSHNISKANHNLFTIHSTLFTIHKK